MLQCVLNKKSEHSSQTASIYLSCSSLGNSYKVKDRLCRCAKPFGKALAVRLRALHVPGAGSVTAPGCQSEGNSTAETH